VAWRLAVHKPFHALGRTDPQVTFDEKPLKTGYCSRDFACMLIDKLSVALVFPLRQLGGYRITG
jgi:hypothetical protein